MPTYIQRTNRNSFTLRYKKYKRLRSDIWGRLAFINKNNTFMTQMREYAEGDLRRAIKCRPINKRKVLYRRFQLARKLDRNFEYSITIKPRAKRNKRLTFRGSLILIRKKFTAFYGLRYKQKSLRKIFAKVGRKHYTSRNRILITSTPRFIPTFPSAGLGGSMLESRIDVILYRLNFIQYIYEGRRFLREKKAFVLGPCKRKSIYRKFFSFFTLKEHYHKVPLFYFVSLRYDLSLLRKVLLCNLIYARKLMFYPPKYLLVNYKTMIGLRHVTPRIGQIRYPFPGTLSRFLGLAVYF